MFSGLKCRPLSTALPPPLRTTQLLGDSKPVVTMGTGLMWQVERVGVQAAVRSSEWAPQPLPYPSHGGGSWLSPLGSGFHIPGSKWQALSDKA